jgi:hypothetical protein
VASDPSTRSGKEYYNVGHPKIDMAHGWSLTSSQCIQCLPFGISCHSLEANTIYKAELYSTEESIYEAMVIQRLYLSNRSVSSLENDLASFIFMTLSLFRLGTIRTLLSL